METLFLLLRAILNPIVICSSAKEIMVKAQMVFQIQLILTKYYVGIVLWS